MSFTLAALGRAIFSKVGVGILIALAVLLAGLWAYDWAYDRGHAKATADLSPVIAKLSRELTAERAVTTAYRTTIDNQNTAHATALSKLKEEQQAALDTAKQDLDKRDLKIKTLEKRNAQVIKYVSVRADSACTVPAGFVRFHDLQATGAPELPDPTGTASAATVPTSGSADADTPSGIALSAVAQTVGGNYASCNETRETLKLWQTWYKGALTSWTKALQTQANFTVVLPTSPTP